MKKFWMSVICVVVISVAAWKVHQQRLVKMWSGSTYFEVTTVVEVVPLRTTNSESGEFFDTKYRVEGEDLTKEFFQEQFRIIKSEENLDSAKEVGQGSIAQMMLEVFGGRNGEEAEVELRREPRAPTECSVSFICKPADSRVYVNGKLLQQGSTIAMRVYPVGETLQCRFESAGYKELERSITVPKKAYQVYRVALLPEVSSP